jgi:hypothetical protein
MLLKCAAVQQAESSMSQRHGFDASQHAPSGQHGKDASVHQPPRNNGGRIAVPIHECVGPIHDARNTLNARRRWWGMRGKVLAVAIILDAADATIAAKTRA